MGPAFWVASVLHEDLLFLDMAWLERLLLWDLAFADNFLGLSPANPLTGPTLRLADSGMLAFFHVSVSHLQPRGRGQVLAALNAACILSRRWLEAAHCVLSRRWLKAAHRPQISQLRVSPMHRLVVGEPLLFRCFNRVFFDIFRSRATLLG